MYQFDLAAVRDAGVALLPAPKEFRQDIGYLDTLWQRFLALPQEVKHCFEYTPDDGVSGVGYEPPRESGERKHTFHVRLAERAYLESCVQKSGSVEATRFIEETFSFLESVKPCVEALAKNVEAQLHQTGFTNAVREKLDGILLRFLFYEGGLSVGEEFARSHSDKGTMTLRVFESTPGTQCLSLDGTEWVESPLQDRWELIAGMLLQLRSRCVLRAACHRVIVNAVSAHEGRSAIVVFIDALSTHVFNKEEYKAQQRFPAGFFYHMPFGRFKKVFQEEIVMMSTTAAVHLLVRTTDPIRKARIIREWMIMSWIRSGLYSPHEAAEKYDHLLALRR